MAAFLAPSRLAGVLLLAATVRVSAETVTPVEKVVQLLKELETQIAEEGKVEAAQYDKYACFCKEQADDHLYAVGKSEKKMKKLNADIEALSTEISPLSAQISQLTQKIGGLEDAIKQLVTKRAQEHADYLEKVTEVEWCIEALDGAIKALKGSKAAMTDAKLNLVQLRELATRVLQTIQRSSSLRPSDAQLAAVQVLLGGSQPSYTYHSNDIIATLEALKVQFKENRKDLDEAELAAKGSFEKEKLNTQGEKESAEDEKAEAEKLVEMKQEQLATAKADLLSVTKDKEADEALLQELTSNCEAKAKLFDQRSSTRAGELTAISKAMTVLESGVEPNWHANKKLVDLQTVSRLVRVFGGRAVSLLQQGSVSAAEGVLLSRVVSLLESAAQRLQSPLLATLSIKAQVQIDHFVKVRGLIKDFIAKLKADAEAEAETKSFCDEEMIKATTTRDESRAELENTLDAETAAQIAKWKAEIQAATDEISGLYKALKEAKELRAAEKAANAKTLADAAAGAEAVKFAITVLQDFYGTALLQRTGRGGVGIRLLEPEIFDGEYHGKQEASGGIIAILEIIRSDFERTSEVVGHEEAHATDEFETLERDTNENIEVKQKGIAETQAHVTEFTDKLAEIQQKNKDAKAALDIALAQLEKLKGMCIEGGETWEERNAKREREIAALKEAMAILDNWKNPEGPPESIQGIVDAHTNTVKTVMTN